MFSVTSLDPHPRTHQSKPFPSLSKPNLVGFFSVDAERQYDGSAAQLKYLTLPPEPRTNLRIDLNDGFEIRRPKPESAKDERIDMLLTFIRESGPAAMWTRSMPADGEPSSTNILMLRYDFVCFRGLLRLIACTPYEWKSGWIIQAIRYRGTIYLCEKPTAEKLEAERNETEQQKRFCYYGFKFEQHILTEQPNKTPDTSKPVEISEEFCSMFESTLDGNRVLYGAEMDGIVTDSRLDRERLSLEDLRRHQFVEVKVKRQESTQRQKDNFYRFKTKNWWCQSFLVNVQRLIVGLRDDSGIVREITEMQLKDIDRDSRHHWSSAVCMNFCAQFLREVADIMHTVDNCRRVYQFEYNSADHRRPRYRVLDEGHTDAFLPSWYTNYVEEMQPKAQ